MATTGILTVPMTDLALSSLHHRLERPRCRFERTAGTAATTTNCLWIQGSEDGAVETALTADPTVCSHERVFASGEEALYDVEFSSPMGELFERLSDNGATVLDAYADEDVWTFHLRFPTREAFSAAVTACSNVGFGVTVRRVFDADSPRNGDATVGITDGQYEALRLAVENGYFDVPRQVTLQELAQMYGCTHQALSEMLRRATRSLAMTITAMNATPTERRVSNSD